MGTMLVAVFWRQCTTGKTIIRRGIGRINRLYQNQVADAVIHLLHLLLGCLSPKEIYVYY